MPALTLPTREPKRDAPTPNLVVGIHPIDAPNVVGRPRALVVTGVSERTLRDCCHEYLAMSSIRYAWLWRMRLVRKALTLANPTSSNVTRIANHFGFSELGRFSVNYCALFGESPSVTLRRPPQAASPKAPVKVRAGRVNSAAPLEKPEPARSGMQGAT